MGCLTGEGVRWDTVELRRSTTFKCTGSAAEPLKTAITDENTVVLLADFYRAGDGNDESFTAQMIVSADDVAPTSPESRTSGSRASAVPRRSRTSAPDGDPEGGDPQVGDPGHLSGRDTRGPGRNQALGCVTQQRPAQLKSELAFVAVVLAPGAAFGTPVDALGHRQGREADVDDAALRG
jgi:hypothetical protein